MYFDDLRKIQGIHSEQSCKYCGEKTSNFEDLSRSRIVVIIKIQNNSMRYHIPFIAKNIKTNDPYIKDNESYTSPGSKISIKNRISLYGFLLVS